MGADLYIDSISDGLKKKYEPMFNRFVKLRNEADKQGIKSLSDKYQEKVEKYYDLMYSEGYFRDSYNFTSVLNQLGLSWWRDISPKLDDKGFMSIPKIKWLLTKIKTQELKILSPEVIKAGYAEGTVEEWQKFFTEKRVRLIQFLEKAIELKEPIRMSV